ncbi:hypothetical protein ARMGADRAFT_1047859 [Armillaria gallica]|uniref:DUF659 domain-containing protein n=1 Tax=Armillaria gallica TaxID=47427 RepID=A0A2H3CTJ8_ARMGA|nr:hypothetical protein ARMGADRAFT_1047859 [Armillaria gallica]
MGPKPASSHGWWRSHFEDHPYFVLKKPEAAQSGRCKVVCIHCLDMCISEVMLADERDVVNRQRSEVRSQKTIKLMSSAGFALSWVENPEWVAFCNDFLPAAKVLSHKAAGKSVTVQCDGWSGQNHHYYVVFMATVDGKVQMVLVDDASDECKTMENLLQRMIEVVKILEKEWSVCIIAFTTDASGELRKARKLLAHLYPHMITPDCYAHQINLIVGDYFKVNQGFLKYSTLATDKTFLLALIQEVQKEKGLQVITVIQAVVTRWTTHYLAYHCLLELQSTLKFLEKRVVTGDVKARQRVNMMLGNINDPLFWHSLARIKVHLEPLAIATNIMQSAFCCLNQVLLTFGLLYMHYTKELSATDSVEKLVQKSDQEVFIAAIVLNPFMKLKPFQHTI